MTMYEYCVRMKAYRLQQVDCEYMLHLLAWQSWDVQAMKNRAESVFRYIKIQPVFDYDEKVEEAMIGKQVNRRGIGKRLMQAARMQKERRKKMESYSVQAVLSVADQDLPRK